MGWREGGRQGEGLWGAGETTRGKGDKRERHAGGRQRRRGEVDRGDRWGRGDKKGVLG